MIKFVRQSYAHYTLWTVTVLAFLLLVGCGQGGSITPTAENALGKLDVVASFYPIEYFANRIGGDYLSVFNPVPPGAEPHDLDLSARTVERIQKAKVFLYLGHGFQPAIDRALDTVKAEGTIAKDVSEGIEMLSIQANGETAPGEAQTHTASDTSRLDPHIWLDPVRAQNIVDNIASALYQAVHQADPANDPIFPGRASQLSTELGTLDDEYRQGLANCKRKEIITSHSAFAYLAQRYGLEQVPVTGVSPEAEPSPARLREIIAFAKQHDARYIFFETLVEPKVAQLLATEVGAQTLVLNPVEGLTQEQAKAGKDYFTIMRDNLANLRLALDCK